MLALSRSASGLMVWKSWANTTTPTPQEGIMNRNQLLARCSAAAAAATIITGLAAVPATARPDG